MSTTSTQQQKQQKSAFELREEEYLAARRAGAEAIEVGRETLEAVTRQGEQLQHAENMADETGYKLDKAGRVLRGMTWSGWVANMFTKDVKPPGLSDDRTGNNDGKVAPSVYEDAPQFCRDAAQAVQNYHANLKVLTTCETEEQIETCHIICENMYRVALTEINKLLSEDGQHVNTTTGATFTNASDYIDDDNRRKEEARFVQKLQKDLTNLRSKQQIKKRLYERQRQEAQQYAQSREKLELSNEPGSSAAARKKSQEELLIATDDPEAQRLLNLQNQHLAGMAQHLDELGNLAISLGEATEKQAALVETLDNKSDSILDKSRMVTRRTDRLIQQKAWSPAKPTYQSCITIQHLDSHKYLAATSNGYLVLQSHFNSESCVFEVWKRQGSIFGLLSRLSRKWVGQNILGNLECRATSFGRRQEFETEKQWKATPLLCASAGWGAGSYVVVNKQTEAVNIAATGSVTSRGADLWCFKETS